MHGEKPVKAVANQETCYGFCLAQPQNNVRTMHCNLCTAILALKRDREVDSV
jgi:hypothetical protein